MPVNQLQHRALLLNYGILAATIRDFCSFGQISVFGYREIAAATVTATLSYMRLEADERLLLYPDRRKENLYRASVAATFRKLAVAGFAPLGRVSFERNRSSLELFDYRRIKTEIGIARAF